MFCTFPNKWNHSRANQQVVGCVFIASFEGLVIRHRLCERLGGNVSLPEQTQIFEQKFQ